MPSRLVPVLLTMAVAGCDDPGEPAAKLVMTPALPVPAATATATTSATAESRPRPMPKTTADCFDVADDWLPRRDSQETGLDGEAIDALIAGAEAAQSDALIVIANDHVVVDRRFGQPLGPIESLSLTKSVVALAILALVADGDIASLDTPLSHYFPEFQAPAKAAVTLRHVLQHSSGLQHDHDDADGLNAQRDRLAFVRQLPVTTPPGTHYSYNNEATQLLSGVVSRAAGKPLDAYVAERLFEPLGIEAGWARDAAGTVQSYYGLRITARALATLGLLLLHEGKHRGDELLPAPLVRALWQPSPTSISTGLLFWRRSNLVLVDDATTLAPQAPGLTALAGRIFRSETELFEVLTRELPPAQQVGLAAAHRRTSLVRELDDGAVGFFAVGGLGQRLLIHPPANLVAVRQHRRRPGDDRRQRLVSYRDFHDQVEALHPALARPSAKSR